MRTFGAVLFEVDKPSIRKPYISKGYSKRVVVSRQAAELNLQSIVGKPLWGPSYSEEYKNDHGHVDVIGTITNACIVGKMVFISGILVDPFPDIKDLNIAASSPVLGISFDGKQAKIEDPNSYIFRVLSIDFIGATVVPQESAAFGKDTLFWVN